LEGALFWRSKAFRAVKRPAAAQQPAPGHITLKMVFFASFASDSAMQEDTECPGRMLPPAPENDNGRRLIHCLEAEAPDRCLTCAGKRSYEEKQVTLQSWIIYLTLVLIATATPGPAVLFIMTHSTLHGWRKASFAALGNITGLLILGLIAVTGLGTVLKTSELVFNVIKYAGAAYLVWLGLKLIFQKTSDFSKMEDLLAPSGVSRRQIYFRGMGVALSNPKAIVFLTALFPQFVDIHEALAPQFALLIAVLMFFSFSFLTSYAILAHQARVWLTKPRRVRIFNRASGSMFIGFGVLLARSSLR
jgi:homoserine/homoserine lactone efflux protein